MQPKPAPLAPIALSEIEAAARRLAGSIVRTPLLRLEVDAAPAEIYLKLENLQPIGSFKLRGAGNAIAASDPAELRTGIVTASAGNMAQGVAWHARRLGVPCTVFVPEHAPATKLAAIRRLGGRIERVPYAQWWQIITTHRVDHPGRFIHPVADPAVIAGNGTIGLEIVEDLPAVDAIVIPFGGGGLCTGIATAARALQPGVRIYTCEVETAAPLAASLAAGELRSCDYRPSFVDGIGAKGVLEVMWPLLRQLVDAALVASLREIADAIRLLAERQRIVAEGAGAAATAAVLAGRAGTGRIACIVSGGNIDSDKLATILAGGVPQLPDPSG